MSILRVYLDWVNSVLSDTGQQVSSISDLQGSEVIQQIVRSLCPGQRVLQGPSSSPPQSLQSVLTFIKSHGIRTSLTAQALDAGDVKSILDLLWTLILHFCIHTPRRRVEKRTIRNGKRLTLRWCQKQLPGSHWDNPTDVTHSLCSHDNFLQLLRKFSRASVNDTESKEIQISKHLAGIESIYKIKAELISPGAVVDGTLDDHSLLIYLSLLRWRVGDTHDSGSSSEDESRQMSNENSVPIPRLSNLNKRVSSLSRLDTVHNKDESLSTMLKSYAHDDGFTKNNFQKMSDKKNVTFLPNSGSVTSNGPKSVLKLPRPNSAPTSRSALDNSHAPTHSPGRFARSFSPTRYAKSFEIPPEKKQELEDRTAKINGSIPRIVTSPAEARLSESNALSEETSDWLSSDMESQGSHKVLGHNSSNNSGVLGGVISSKVKEAVPGNSTDSEKAGDSSKPHSSNYSHGVDLAALQSRNLHNNFRIPVGSVPMFGPTSGVPMMSGVGGGFGGGVPLYLLPGHSPEVTQHVQILLQQQLARQALGYPTEGVMNFGDGSMLETSGSGGISEGDFTSSSNIGDETSLYDSRGRFEKSHSQDSSEAELKQLGCGSPKDSRRTSQSVSPQRMTDSGCGSQSRPESNTELRIPEDDSLRKIRLLRETLQKPVDEKSSQRDQRSGHTDDLSADKQEKGDVFLRVSGKASSSQPEPAKEQKALYRSDTEVKTTPESRHEPLDDPRVLRRETELNKDLVHHLSDELKYLKSKVLTLEKSQEHVGDDNGRHLDDYDRGRTERRRLPKCPPQRSHHSPPRSLFNSPECTDLSSLQASKRARDTVNDLLITMQSPLSRRKAEESMSQSRTRREFNKRPQSFSGFGRSQSEDRLQGRATTRETSASDWGSRSLQGGQTGASERNALDARSRSLQDLSTRGIHTGILTDADLIVKPPSAVPIMYGYSSPIQKVSADIWGADLTDLDNLEPGRRERWKRLVQPKQFMTDSEIIELKQCLASATMENEILHAKVSNASLEVGEKMTKMAQVLEETKLSLIKTQSENETLHTQLGRERQRAETLEIRVADMEAQINKTQTEAERLGNELQEAHTLLGGTNADGIHLTEQENYQLKRQLHLLRDEQRKTLQELEGMKLSRDRAHSAVKDLHGKLEDTREENDFLSREIEDVRSAETSYRKTATLLSRGADIRQAESSRVDHADLDVRPDRLETGYSQSPADVTPARYLTTSTPYSKAHSSHSLITSSPSRGRFVPRVVSPTEISPVKSYPSRPSKYNYEEISPAVHKEIYPHRRPRSALFLRSDSDVTPDNRRRKWSLTGKLNYSDCDLGESVVEKPYSDSRHSGLPPHPDPLRDSQSSVSSRTSKPSQLRNRSYADEIDRLKSHLSRSFRSEESLHRSRSHYDRNSSLPFEPDIGQDDYERIRNQGRQYSEFTPQNSTRASIRSPSNCHAPVRGILKPASSDQDLRRVGRSSPPSRRSASPNVTFNTKVASRAISPPAAGRRRDETGVDGVPLFGVPSRRYGVVRNLNDEFDNEEPVRDCGIEPTAFRTNSWLDSKSSPSLDDSLTFNQHHYADLLIDKYLARRPYYYD